MKKKILLCLAMIFASFSLSALPGITQYIPDASGEYVYYRDNTFSRTSYVGIIYYNEETIAIRYYAPASLELGQPDSDVTLYLTINSESDYMEFKGETMKGVKTEDETEVVNYLHDILYEFNSRRQKVTLTDTEKQPVTEDFEQFGGKVNVVYSASVPLFNIQEIRGADGKILLQTATMGALVNSEDKSFENFKGFEKQTKNTEYKFSNNKRAKKVTISFDGLKIFLDRQWTQDMDNLWELGENALLVLNKFVVPEGYEPQLFYDTLMRKTLMSTEGSYLNMSRNSVTQKANRTSVKSFYYQPDTNTGLVDFKIFIRNEDESYSYIDLTVYENIYDDNRDYFNKIIDSIK